MSQQQKSGSNAGKTKRVIIVGAGLVGSLWAVYLSKAGYQVKVYERRPYMRKAIISAGKSINLAVSYRGWKALDEMGIGDDIREIAIPMYGRNLHHPDGSQNYQPYGNYGQAIYSVSRGEINKKLMDIASSNQDVRILFDEECVAVRPEDGYCQFKNTITGALTEDRADLVFAADGAFSACRYHGLQKKDRFDYSQKYLPDGYKEILLPRTEAVDQKMAKNTLHIWPRGRFMLIALPNLDGSYTCTLFMPFEDEKYGFNQLTDKAKIIEFFEEVFPDFYQLMPSVADDWDKHPLSSLAIIRCFPWTDGKLALLGDAAHATVPFFGQGMNCGFEDCTILWQLMQSHGQDWSTIFEQYQLLRKPNGDAVQDLSLQNYIVMRDKVMDPHFQLVQKLERRINYLYPESYFPLYSMVSFSQIEYRTALKKGNEQEERIRDMIKTYKINPETSESEIDAIIHQKFQQN
ncbi:MAG TPA: NAD(P)/FAD-dependent oxidoreductase [Saprospiraceae bacterium]|nr:NAD(P)/FAD-dependent oxidoreductase [Saprospiraceae bacterium]